MSFQRSRFTGRIGECEQDQLLLFNKTKDSGFAFFFRSPLGSSTTGLYNKLSLLFVHTTLSLRFLSAVIVRSFGSPRTFVTKLSWLLPQKYDCSSKNQPVGSYGTLGYDTTRYSASTVSVVPRCDIVRTPGMTLSFGKRLFISNNGGASCLVYFGLFPSVFKEVKMKVRCSVKVAYTSSTELAIVVSVTNPTSDMSVTGDKSFLGSVREVANGINAGDIMQLQVSRRFLYAVESYGKKQLLKVMHRINPSPFTFEFSFRYYQITGSSPETLIDIRNGNRRLFSIKPIAGTRPRSESQQQDLKFKGELTNSTKEVAEHIMLIDLARNDLGRVVGVEDNQTGLALSVEQYSHVQHIVSTVKCRSKGPVDNLEAVWASFPAGTVSGTPKQQAVTLIGGHEKVKRSFYGGAVGFVSSREIDLALAIRTALVLGRSLHTQSAAGIVYDSVPCDELRETNNKAIVVASTLKDISEGSVAF